MKFCLRILSLLLLVGGTLTQDGFDLADALDDVATTPPKLKPKTTEKPKSDGGLDLADALKPGPTPKMDNPPKVPPKSGGGGGSFDDSDLFDVGAGDYKPDGGRSGGRAVDPGNDPQGGPDQPQGSGPVAGIISAIGVALVGAASSYFAYQKKKLCFKIQGGQDPESGKVQQGSHSDPQVFSTLMQSDRT